MTIWLNCRMASLYYSSREALENIPCTVKILDKRIRVEYEEGGKTVWYEGEDEGNDHFSLIATHTQGQATLHRSPARPEILEGYWVEGSYRGMWRIELSEPDE